MANRRRNWATGIAGGTRLNASNLNAMEDDIGTALDARVLPGVMSSGGAPGVAFREAGAGSQYLDVTFPSGVDFGWLVSCFTANGAAGEKLSVFYSADGKTIFGGQANPVYANGTLGVRDPSTIRIGSTWFMAHTSNNGNDKNYKIASGPDLASLTPLATIDVSAVADIKQAWAPEFVVDPAAPTRPYIFWSRISLSGNTGAMYWQQATNDALTAWTAPVRMAWTAEPGHYIDGAFIKVGNQWQMYYSTGGNIERAVSNSLTGTYATDKSGNWAGWGAGVEGAEIVKVPGSDKYRIYMDRFQAGTGYAWSESTDLTTWTPLVNMAVPAGVMPPGSLIRHGSFLPLPDQAAANSVMAATVAQRGSARAEFTASKSIPNGAVTNAGQFTLDAAHSNTAAGELASSDANGVFTMAQGGSFRVSGTVVVTAAPATTIRAFLQATGLTGYNGAVTFTRASLGPNGEDNYSFQFDAEFSPGDTWKVELYHGHTAALTHAVRLKLTKVGQ